MPPEPPMHHCALSTTTISRHKMFTFCTLQVNLFMAQHMKCSPFANQHKCSFATIPVLTNSFIIIPQSPIIQIPNAPNPQSPIGMSDNKLDTLCLWEETVCFLYQSMKQWNSRNEGIGNRKYQDDQPPTQSQSHVHHYNNSSPRRNKQHNNCSYISTSPSDVGTTSKMQSILSMNTTTDLTVTQETASTCTHAPK